jgi:hypothetical protein
LRPGQLCLTVVQADSNVNDSFFPINMLRNVAADTRCAKNSRWVMHLDAEFQVYGEIDINLLCPWREAVAESMVWVVPALEWTDPSETTSPDIDLDVGVARKLIHEGRLRGFRASRGYTQAQRATQVRSKWLESPCTDGVQMFPVVWERGYEPFGFGPSWAPPFDERFHGAKSLPECLSRFSLTRPPTQVDITIRLNRWRTWRSGSTAHSEFFAACL